MIIEDMKNNFINDWNETGVYHCKGLMSDLPDWNYIVNVLNIATRKENTTQEQNMVPSPFEVPYKDLLAVKTLSYSKEKPNEFVIESDATFFFSIFFDPRDKPKMISTSLSNQIDEMENIFDISLNFSSLKIALSDKFVPYENHSWHTCIVQIAGINKWELKDDRQNFKETYILEPGDILFFKEGIYHQISNEGPRSSVVGRFTLNSEVENA